MSSEVVNKELNTTSSDLSNNTSAEDAEGIDQPRNDS